MLRDTPGRSQSQSSRMQISAHKTTEKEREGERGRERTHRKEQREREREREGERERERERGRGLRRVSLTRASRMNVRARIRSWRSLSKQALCVRGSSSLVCTACRQHEN